MTERNKVLVLGGPTASGKSRLALELARTRRGVVINADALQLYKGLETLSAQPDQSEKQAAPHRLYGVLDPDAKATAAKWRDMALGEIKTAQEAGLLPIVTGGTGLYLKTLMQGLSPIPDVAPDIRARINAQQAKLGNPRFHAALEKIDPVMAARLNPNDTQRLIRAYEVFEATGKSLDAWQKISPITPPGHLEFLTVLILPDRAQLYATIEARVEKMFGSKAVDEVSALIPAVAPDAPITKTLGFSQISGYLSGALSLDQAKDDTKTKTRQYAKRQYTWFSNQIAAPDLVLSGVDAAALRAVEALLA